MTDKVSLLMKSLNDFYKNEKYINILKPILEQESVISLRILDWFITNYSKKYRVIINETFDIYQSYKLQLRSYSKKQFDPFCRKNKILFYYNDAGDYLETSCGQLCFFRWCIQNGILDFVAKSIDVIENDMKKSIQHSSTTTQKRIKDSPKKRQTLSVSASRTVSKRKVTYTVSFE
jgi:hypothetical protein